MKLGFFTMPHHPLGRDWSTTLQEDREAVILADQLGFREAFIGEHATDAAENITSCLAFIASVAYETKNIRLGTGTLNLPNGHPAAFASQAAMLDHMLEGRFMLGVGPGALASDFEVFGTLEEDRMAMFVESIEHILGIWTGEPPYNLEGNHWAISSQKTTDPEYGGGFLAKPFQKPTPEIVCTALAPYSKGAAAVAQRGWSLISSNFVQEGGVSSHWQAYLEGCNTAGTQGDGNLWRVARSIFVADDQKTAEAYGLSLDGPYGLCTRHIHHKLKLGGKLGILKARRDEPDDTITPEYCMRNLMIVGTPDVVAEKILAFRESVGPFATLLYVGVDWQDKALAQRSMELMANEVMPRVNARLGQK
ncbi:MAG: LLM class flavin-dependent oxidoreductase [Proteobacteria bacterium]|nr:LLM class flavin-dependent oxidoreductase [Pseudomonadota bacterium]